MISLDEELPARQPDAQRHPVFRLHIDEVGNSDLDSSHIQNQRYLSLTGVALKLTHAEKLGDELQRLKDDYFPSGDGKLVILHRREIMRKQPPFDSLNDPRIEKEFNERLLRLIERFQYKAFTVVIDKLEHCNRYEVWRAQAYHYCLEVLIERYALFLSSIYSCGDVVVESRGKTDDEKLKSSFSRIYRLGTSFQSPKLFSARLTNEELMLKKKLDNDPGLQLADLLAHPSYRSMKMEQEGKTLPDDFGGKIAQILIDSKYHRGRYGKIDGYGRKWLSAPEKPETF